jgi:cytochrome c oxidase assembly protein subunit 11
MMFQTTIREKFSPRLLLCHTGNNNIIITSNPWFWRRQSLRRMVGDSTTTSSKSNANMALTAQNRSFEYYQRKQQRESWFWNRSSKKRQQRTMTAEERNIQVAWYMVAVVVGAIGATYASVPLYKVFCQATGFGGTTQRVIFEGTNGQPNTLEKAFRSLMQTVAPKSSARVHTWTDEEAAQRLASLKPVENANLITVRFDSTINDRMPWSFVPVALDVKVVPGETALSFFRVTNHSDKAITGVATYNVHPPKVGLYFQKIQCFCFEEQRLLPGETVDMPVFFFIDPEMLDDPQVSYITDVTLSYTFFQTDEDDDQEDEEQK